MFIPFAGLGAISGRSPFGPGAYVEDENESQSQLERIEIGVNPREWDGGATRIWIDTDVALGGSRGDVDDGFALAAVVSAAARGDGVDLLGISAVSGNVDGAIARALAESIIRAHGAPPSEVPIVAEEDAPSALAGLSDGTALLAIGPPTNLVKAAEIDPSFPSRVSVRAVGRLLEPARHPILGLFDLNFRRHPGASERFFRLAWRERLLFPLDVVRALRFGAYDLDRIARASAFGAHLSRGAERWLRRAPLRYLSRSFPVWDLVAAMDAIGRLPGRQLDAERGMLAGFDAEATKAAFFALLERG
jgi:inosine-uridine nucleoside N-ribohydrolase